MYWVKKIPAEAGIRKLAVSLFAETKVPCVSNCKLHITILQCVANYLRVKVSIGDCETKAVDLKANAVVDV
jgi:hypothetical protein